MLSEKYIHVLTYMLLKFLSAGDRWNNCINIFNAIKM